MMIKDLRVIAVIHGGKTHGDCGELLRIMAAKDWKYDLSTNHGGPILCARNSNVHR